MYLYTSILPVWVTKIFYSTCAVRYIPHNIILYTLQYIYIYTPVHHVRFPQNFPETIGII